MAKSTTTAPRKAAASTALVATADTPGAVATAPTVSPLFGINLVINGKPVTVTGSALDPTQGFEFTLPGPVDLGDIANLADALKPFGINFPDVSTFPPPFDTIAGFIMSIDFGVEAFHIKVPGKGSTDPTLFTFQMSATVPVAQQFTIAGVTVTGVVFGASNELTTTSA